MGETLMDKLREWLESNEIEIHNLDGDLLVSGTVNVIEERNGEIVLLFDEEEHILHISDDIVSII